MREGIVSVGVKSIQERRERLDLRKFAELMVGFAIYQKHFGEVNSQDDVYRRTCLDCLKSFNILTVAFSRTERSRANSLIEAAILYGSGRYGEITLGDRRWRKIREQSGEVLELSPFNLPFVGISPEARSSRLLLDIIAFSYIASQANFSFEDQNDLYGLGSYMVGQLGLNSISDLRDIGKGEYVVAQFVLNRQLHDKPAIAA